MNLDRLHAILAECTVQLRKGDMVRGDPHLVAAVKQGRSLLDLRGGVVTIDAMPHHSEIAGVEKVDCHFLMIGVDKARAMERRDELAALLKSYPRFDRLERGISFVEVAGEIGDQAAAFRLFALGQVVGWWSVVTPATIGVTGPEADQLAGQGYVMNSRFRPGFASAAGVTAT